MSATSTRKGVGAIMSGKTIGHPGKKVKGTRPGKAERKQTGQIMSGKVRTGKAQTKKNVGAVYNPLMGALKSGKVMQHGEAERVKIGRHGGFKK